MGKEKKDEDLLPPYSKDLIDQLDQMIPHRCPNQSMSERAIWIYAGKRELVDMLKSRLKYTEDHELVSEMS